MVSRGISLGEFEQRHDRIRSFVADQGLGALLVYSPPQEHKWGQTGHVAYLSGWANCDRIVDSAVVVPVTGDPVMLLAGMPYMLKQIEEVSPLRDLRLVRAVDPHAVAVSGGADRTGPRSFSEEVVAILRENRIRETRVGVVGIEHMPVPFYEALARELGDDLRRVTDVVAECRSIKTPSEIELMKRAAQLSDVGFQTMVEVAEEGMRGIEIVAEMERVVRREGADHAKYWMASGPPPNWADVRLDLKPHERVLREGDLMASCSYVQYKGYWCHGQRTGTMKSPSPELDRLCAIGREAQDAGLEKIRPETPVAHVGRAIRKTAAHQGFEIQGGRVGHGMGMDYAERPGLAESSDELLQAGMTFVVHAAYGLPGSGAMFVPLGDVCHVTPQGPELLMEFPRTPFIAGR